MSVTWVFFLQVPVLKWKTTTRQALHIANVCHFHHNRCLYKKKIAKGKIYAPFRVKFLGLKLRLCKKRDKYQVCQDKLKEWAFAEAFLNCFVRPNTCGSVWVSFEWMALVGMVVAWPCLTQHSPFVLSWRCLCRKSIQAEGKLKVQHCDSAGDSKSELKEVVTEALQRVIGQFNSQLSHQGIDPCPSSWREVQIWSFHLLAPSSAFQLVKTVHAMLAAKIIVENFLYFCYH